MKTNFICISLLIITLLACSSQPKAPQEPSERAQAAQVLLVKMEQDPASSALQKEFLSQFRGIYHTENVPWASIAPATYSIYGAMLNRAYQMAREGCNPCLQAIMRANLGPLGRTSHGSEMLSEMLWDLLLDHAQRSLNAMAELSASERRELIEDVYTHPLHDNYDFAKMLAALQEATVPPKIQKEAKQIIAVVQRDADYRALRNIDKKLGVVSRDYRNNLILTIANSGIKIGTEVAIVSAPKQSYFCCAEIVKNLGQNPGVGHQIILSGHTTDTTYIMLMNKHGAAIDLGFGIVDDPKIISSKKGIIQADLNRDGVQDTFRNCTSNEGVHLTLWSGQPLKGPRLWHAYYFLEYDVVPSCQEKDYTD